MNLPIENLTPGTYYQDLYEDGTMSVPRKNFPKLSRPSYQQGKPIAKTFRIDISELPTANGKKGILDTLHERGRETILQLHKDQIIQEDDTDLTPAQQFDKLFQQDLHRES